jgi:hypothetical protein
VAEVAKVATCSVVMQKLARSQGPGLLFATIQK